MGVRSVLALGGDPVEIGPYEGRAAEVRDVDAAGLASVIAGLNDGRLAAGEPLEIPTSFLIIGAADPLVDPPDRLRAKIDAGVSLFREQHRLRRRTVHPMAGTRRRRRRHRGGPDPGRRHAPRRRPPGARVHAPDRIPGVEVDDATFAAMRGLDGTRAMDEGIAIAAEIIARLREIPEVAGVHLMAPGWEVEAVPRVVESPPTPSDPRPPDGRPAGGYGGPGCAPGLSRGVRAAGAGEAAVERRG